MSKVVTVCTIKRGTPLLLSVLVLLCVVSWWPQSLAAQTVTRFPYLQQGTPTGVIVRWRTNPASTSRVRYGTDPANLATTVDNTQSTTEHVVTLSGLAPNTKYYYAIGTTTTTLAGGDANHFFFTAPPVGTEQPIRIWALGDSGTANADAVAVRNAYLSLTGSQYTHVWLMLGDNAYNDGTDAEYQTAVFNMYPTVLRQTVLWPTLGNHDGHTADSATQTGPYYDIFTLPTQGQAGGLASGTEAYYAFNYGNIHFVVLDSYETSRAATGAMMTWLRNDLLQNTLPWVIAYWHHPPYTKGSHDSDNESELIEMRQNALPILEQEGVDLVLAGHSHSYERSYLIDGHYGPSSTFTASMKVDGGDGRINGTGEYQKPEGNTPHDGAVYVVAGSSGQISGGTLNHPAMFISLNVLGSLVLDVQGNTMDITFLSNTGASPDHFSIVKVPIVTVAATDATATEAGLTTGTVTVTRTGATTTALTVLYSPSGTATAGSDYVTLSGSVTIPSGAASASITVAPLDDTLVENNETVIVTVTANAAYSVASPSSATVTITSDEAPLPTVSVAATDATATEAGLTIGTFTVTRTGPTTTALTVLYSPSGTATAGSDYVTLSGSVTIPSGAASATITVTPLDDTLVENDETVIVTVTANAAYTVGAPSTATVTMTSDEVSPSTVTIAPTDATATEAGLTTGTFTVTRTGPTTTALTVLYSPSGTATAGSDYVTLSGNVTIPSGAASATITVTPVDDPLVENNETVIVTVTANAAYTVGAPSTATVTISSNDGNLPVVTISAPDATATEAGRTTGQVQVMRTGSTAQALTVQYTVSGTATPGSDYVALSGSTQIAAGSLTRSITITPFDDTLAENNETIVVHLASSAAYSIGTPNSTTITLSSNDVGVPPGPNGEVSLTAQSAYDNKTGKTYVVGGPDGVDPLNDLNTLAEEYKLEIESGNTFWWEATYADPVVGSAAPSEVLVTVQYRSETNWTGTLRVEYYHGTTRLASIPLPVNSSNDPAAGKGQKHTYVWNLSSVVTTAQALSDARVRLINESTNGKKVWVTYSVTNATLDAAP